jgi:hypothetical protein
MKWMSSDGQWVVKPIHLTATRGQDGDWLQVTHHGFTSRPVRGGQAGAGRIGARSPAQVSG